MDGGACFLQVLISVHFNPFSLKKDHIHTCNIITISLGEYVNWKNITHALLL